MTSFLLKVLQFNSLNQKFELIFMYGVKQGSNFVFLHMDISCPTMYPTLFAEKTIFSPLNDLGTLVENQLIPNVWIYFWIIIHTRAHAHAHTFMLIPYCFDCYSFLLKLKIVRCESSNFVLFLNIILAILETLHFHMNFRIS